MNSFSLHAAHMHVHAEKDGGEENRNGRGNRQYLHPVSIVCTCIYKYSRWVAAIYAFNRTGLHCAENHICDSLV